MSDVSSPVESWFVPTLQQLLSRQPLADLLVTDIVSAMLDGLCDDVETATLLVAWHAKGETGSELATAAAVLRQRMQPLAATCPDLLDTCGTGGDGSHTFNISTATAIVLAAAGVKVVKHGNRAASSASGSSDVLSALGVPVEAGPVWAAECLDRFGLGFCFAPQYHPTLARLAPLRRKLRIRTLFNLLGPLANPARAPFQLLGVGRRTVLQPLAEALVRLEIRRAFVIHADDGLDEISLAGPTQVREVIAGRIVPRVWVPEDFGLPLVAVTELYAPDPSSSAAIIQRVVDPNASEDGCRAVVLANAAAGLMLIGRADSLPAGVLQARKAILTGMARRLLERLGQSRPVIS